MPVERKERAERIDNLYCAGNPLLMPNVKLDIDAMFNNIFGIDRSSTSDTKYIPNRILKSGNATIVFWKDGTKTIVKLPEGDTPDEYSAFTAALAKKIFGTNSKVKKVIRTKTEIQKPKEGKKDETVSVPTESVRTDSQS